MRQKAIETAMRIAIKTESYRDSYRDRKRRGKNRNAVNENLGFEFDEKGECSLKKE